MNAQFLNLPIEEKLRCGKFIDLFKFAAMKILCVDDFFC